MPRTTPFEAYHQRYEAWFEKHEAAYLSELLALGQDYLAYQAEHMFYREATFYSAREVEQLLVAARFSIDAWAQTLARPLSATREIESLRAGRGKCAFVVVAATRGG